MQSKKMQYITCKNKIRSLKNLITELNKLQQKVINLNNLDEINYILINSCNEMIFLWNYLEFSISIFDLIFKNQIKLNYYEILLKNLQKEISNQYLDCETYVDILFSH